MLSKCVLLLVFLFVFLLLLHCRMDQGPVYPGRHAEEHMAMAHVQWDKYQHAHVFYSQKKNTYTFANGKSPSKIFQTHVVVLCGCQSGFQFPTAGPQLYDAPVNRKAPPAFLNSLFCRSAAATACFSSWLFLKRLQFADFDKFRLAHAELCAQISQAFSPWFGPGTLGWTKGEWKLYSYIRWFNSGTHKNGNSFTRNANKKDQQGRVKQIYS